MRIMSSEDQAEEALIEAVGDMLEYEDHATVLAMVESILDVIK